MHTAVAQAQRVLQHEGGNPHIVCRDGGTLLTQLPVDGGVMVGGLFIGVQHTYAGHHQKAAQNGFTRSPTPVARDDKS